MQAADTQSGSWTVARLLAWTRDYLERQAVDSPRLCAEILLAHAMGCERIHLYTQFDAVPGPSVLNGFRTNVREAGEGRPIAYVTGAKEFFSLTFEVAPDVLIPRPETEILVERTIDLVRRSDGAIQSILDLGTGSGCIAISLAHHLPNVAICASDISEPALAVARRNAERHGVAERVEFAAGDLLDAWPPATDAGDSARVMFDVIACNPPYVATSPDCPIEDSVRRYEPAAALFAGTDGLDIIRRIATDAPPRLSADGHLLLEVAFDQSSRVCELLDRPEWRDVVTYRDLAGHGRVVHARRAAPGE